MIFLNSACSAAERWCLTCHCDQCKHNDTVGKPREARVRKISFIILLEHHLHISDTGCPLNIMFFLEILWFFWTLPVLLQRWFASCLVCVHTLTPRQNRESSEYLKIFEKTQYLMNTLYYQPLAWNTSKLSWLSINMIVNTSVAFSFSLLFDLSVIIDVYYIYRTWQLDQNFWTAICILLDNCVVLLGNFKS